MFRNILTVLWYPLWFYTTTIRLTWLVFRYTYNCCCHWWRQQFRNDHLMSLRDIGVRSSGPPLEVHIILWRLAVLWLSGLCVTSYVSYLSLALIFDILRPRQNGRFRGRHVEMHFFNENVWIPVKISLKFVPKGPMNNIAALVQIMAWRRPRATHYLNQWWLVYWHIYASPGLSELTGRVCLLCGVGIKFNLCVILGHIGNIGLYLTIYQVINLLCYVFVIFVPGFRHFWT